MLGAPEGFASLLEPLPVGVLFESKAGPRVDIAHLFVTRREELVEHLSALRRKLDPAAALWVSLAQEGSQGSYHRD